ncbi:MAG: hypothetical protein FJX45_19145 [Alphaproteobacteria bacterium]|nr:hypothetical protein [Alphaproteobacteria bacterium]
MKEALFLRRKAAGEYLKSKYGFGSEKTLAKLASVGGGPEFRKGFGAALYEQAALDQWALSKIGEPQTSTSDPKAA